MARLSLAQALGFDFVEMSIDETDQRLARLDWSKAERASLRAAVAETGVTVPSMCLSGHRRFPFGSHDPAIRSQAREIMRKAIDLSVDIGLRTIQLAGYDVYYEPSDEGTRKRFIEGLSWAVDQAARSQVMLAVEIMDTPLINSITAWLEYAKLIDSPFFCVYPDLGNFSAWNNDVPAELRKGIAKIVAIHLKDTLRVTTDFPGQFRDVPFGSGCVDFLASFKTLAELQSRSVPDRNVDGEGRRSGRGDRPRPTLAAGADASGRIVRGRERLIARDRRGTLAARRRSSVARIRE